jgi:hypothetical protein
MLEQLVGFRTRVRWCVRFDHGPLAAALAPLGPACRRVPIHVLPVGPDYGRAFAGYHATLRNHIRKAQRRGLAVREAAGDKDVEDYHAIYARYARERGWRFTYPLELSRRLLRLGDAVRFFVGECDGRVVTGGMFIRDGASVYYLHCVGDPAYSRLYPSCAVIDRGVRWACESGAAFFNLGNSGTNASLAQFKSSWGAHPESDWLFEWHGPLWWGPVGLVNGSRRVKAAAGKLMGACRSVLRKRSV